MGSKVRDELFRAIASKDVPTVHRILATQGQFRECIKYVEGGIGTGGDTPLRFAARNAYTEAMKELLRSGVLINSKSKDGATALALAAERGHVEVIKILAGDEDLRVNSSNKNNVTPLMLAACNGHDAAVELLIKAKANLDDVSCYGINALMLAARHGHAKTVKLLVAAGATLDTEESAEDETVTKSTTALASAALNGHADIVAMLAKAGATVDARTHDGFTPLMIASIHGHQMTASTLLQHGADRTLVSGGKTAQLSALDWAKNSGHADVLEVLMAPPVAGGLLERRPSQGSGGALIQPPGAAPQSLQLSAAFKGKKPKKRGGALKK